MRVELAAAVSAAALATTFLASCASTQRGWYDGENLLQPLPIPGESWNVKQLVNEKQKMEKTRWTRSRGSGSEQFEVIVIHEQRNIDVKLAQADSDHAALKYCSSYLSDVVEMAADNDYKTITWKTKCKLREDGSDIVILHKAISGEDSLYAIQKTWTDSFTDESGREWIDYVRRIRLCNSRGTQHPCPEGFKRIQ